MIGRSVVQEFRVHPLDAAHVLADGEAGQGMRARRLAHGVSEIGVAQERGQGLGQRGGVVRRDEETRLAVHHYFGDPSDATGNGRDRQEGGLNQNTAKPL